MNNDEWLTLITMYEQSIAYLVLTFVKQSLKTAGHVCKEDNLYRVIYIHAHSGSCFKTVRSTIWQSTTLRVVTQQTSAPRRL